MKIKMRGGGTKEKSKNSAFPVFQHLILEYSGGGSSRTEWCFHSNDKEQCLLGHAVCATGWQSPHFACSTGVSMLLSCDLQKGVTRHQKTHFRHHHFGGRCAQVSCYNTSKHWIHSEMVREIHTDPIYSFLLLLLFSPDFCPELTSLLSGLALSCVF